MPLALGAMMYLPLSAAINNEWIVSEQILRYLTGHPISKLTTAMFLVGVASLLMISLNLVEQFTWLQKIGLPASDSKAAKASETDDVLEGIEEDQVDSGKQLPYLDGLPQKVKEHYLWKRLSEAVQYVHRTGSATNVDEELKYVSDNDHASLTQRYSLVRIMIWAMPMLGFLGTVLGISQALGGLNLGADRDFNAMMGSLQSSLYVAFDTTALALTLSIILMFATFLVERFEVQLLDQVETIARKEISDQFDFTGKPDSAVQTMERIGRTVLAATHEVVQKQAELWQNTIVKAEDAWLMNSTNTHEVLRHNLNEVVHGAVLDMGEILSQSVTKADESLASRWEQWQITLSDNARQVLNQQDSMKQMIGLVQSVLSQLENLGEFQKAMNRNLDGLAATERLDTTLARLTEVVSELNRKLGLRKTNEKEADSDKSQIPSTDKPFNVRIAEGTARAA